MAEAQVQGQEIVFGSAFEQFGVSQAWLHGRYNDGYGQISGV